MRNALGVLAVAAASALAACAAPAEVTTATLALHTLPSCELPAVSQVRLRASGDFPAIDDARKAQGGAPITLDEFPVETRYLAFEVGAGAQRAGGLMTLPAGQGDVARDVLLLPYATSCPLGDRLAFAARGAALAPLPDGGLLIAGGSGADGVAVADARVLPSGDALVKDVPGGMLFRRAGASATLAGDRVVVAGGGADDGAGATANDTFEIYDVASGMFDKLRSDHFDQSRPRRDHGAALLGNGRVLLVGGCRALGTTLPSAADADRPRCTATGAQPLANAEWIDLERGASTTIDDPLEVARVQPRVLVLDSGRVLIVLGWDEAGVPVPEVERFDPAARSFSDVHADLPVHANAAVTALEGDRVFYVGCDGANAGCEIALLVPEGDGFTRADTGALDGEPLRDLEQLRLLPLHDGRVLLGARLASTRMRTAFIVDLSERTLTQPAGLITRVPDQLLELADGTRVEADAEGLSLAREDVRSPFDDAPDPVVSSTASQLVPDVAARWHIDRGLRASAEARADLPLLRFAEVRITLELDKGATGTLLLEPAAAPPVELKISRATIAIARDCSMPRDPDAPLVIERHAGELTLHNGDGRKTCESAALDDGRIGIAMRLAQDTVIRSLHVTRL